MFVFVFVCLPVGCLNCSMHVVNRLSCGQVTLSFLHPLLLSAPHFRLAACCTYFRFCTFLAFSLPWSLLAFSLPPFFFFCCTLRFSHLFGAVTFSLSPFSRLPSPFCLRPVVLAAVVAAAGNDFNLLLTSLKFRNCNGNTQHDFDPSIGAHNYSSSANSFGGRGDNSAGCQSLQSLHKLKELIRLGRGGARKRNCL